MFTEYVLTCDSVVALAHPELDSCMRAHLVLEMMTVLQSVSLHSSSLESSQHD